MPLPILPLIRAAITGAHTHTQTLYKADSHTLAQSQSSGLCMPLASHCVVLCSDQTDHSIRGSDGNIVTPLLFCSSGCCQLRQMSNLVQSNYRPGLSQSGLIGKAMVATRRQTHQHTFRHGYTHTPHPPTHIQPCIYNKHAGD